MVIIGTDFHSRFERLAVLDAETGEVEERRVEHGNQGVRKFYASLPRPDRVGIECTGHTLWCAELMRELGHELVVGDATKIRASATRPQKHDRRDAAVP